MKASVMAGVTAGVTAGSPANPVRVVVRLLILLGFGHRQPTGPRPWRLVAAAGLGTVASLAGVAMVGLAGYLVCRAAEQPPILALTTLAVGVRATALLRPLARYGERLLSHDVALRCLGDVRVAVYRRLVPLAPAEAEAFRDGDLLARTVSDVDAAQDLVLRVVLPVGVAIGTGTVVVAGVAAVCGGVGAAGVVSAVSVVSAVPGVLALGLMIGAVLPGACAAGLAARSARRQAALRGRLTADLVDALGAAEELWLAGADGRTAAELAATDRALVAISRRDAWAAGAANAVDAVVAGCTVLAVLGLATAAAARAELDPLLVAPLTLVSVATFEAVRPLAVAARILPGVLAAGRRVLELVDAEPTVTDPAPVAGLVTDQVAQGDGLLDVDLRGVTVRRGPVGRRRVAVRGADLRCAAGERVLLGGPSGSGKTTLAYLLVRFLDRERDRDRDGDGDGDGGTASGGTARLGRRDLRDWRGDEVRARVLLSEQEPHVFDTTIRENLALARPDATDAEITEALRRARLDAFVASLPGGLATPVGERGRRLSGGQRQRLALARAFLLDPDVLVLDEPTAHLDVVTASALLDDLWQQAGDRSLILVTHADPGPFTDCRRHRAPSTEGAVVEAHGPSCRLFD